MSTRTTARMATKTTAGPLDRLESELVGLLHRDAPAEAFAPVVAAAEALPDGAAKVASLERVRMALAVRERLDLQQQRERGLLAVIESAQDLSSRRDPAGLLTAIVSRARNLLGADVGWLSVHDPERDDFRVMVADGALSQRTPGMVTRRDFGVAGVVMATRLPYATPDYLHDRSFAHDPGLDDAFRAEGIVALVGVPLLWEGEVVGLLFVADRYRRTHTAPTIAILCALATHGAVALNNARDFERAQVALVEADRVRAELERHVRDVQAATDAHERLTQLLARGASMATLCRTVAELLDADVLVLDEAGEVVSRGFAARGPGDGARTYAPHGAHATALADAARSSRRSGRSVEAYAADGERCRLMLVTGGADVLGSVLLIHRDALPDIAIRTFERSASIVGIVLVSQERVEATKSSSAAALLRALVSPRNDDPALLHDRAGRLGLDLTASLSLTVVDIDGPSAAFSARRLRTLSALAGALVDDLDGRLVVVCETTKAADVDRAVAQVVGAAPGATFRGVRSRPIADAADVPSVHASVARAVRLLRRLGVSGRLVAQNALALYATLFETQDAAGLAEYLEAQIGPLVAHDRRKRTALSQTLLCYFDCNQNAKRTAQRLAVHVNTIRQRLGTIESLIGPWSDASRALEIQVALRLADLRSTLSSDAAPR